MIPQHIQQLLDERGYSRRTNDKEAICKTLDALGIEPSSELGEFYLGYHPSLLRSTSTHEQLEDVVIPVVDGAAPAEADPSETPVGMATRFVREVWEVPERMLSCDSLVLADEIAGCLSNADGLRVGKETPSESRKFIYDFRKLLQETDGADDPQRWYTFTTEEYGDLISQYDGADTLYHQYDGLGSTDALLDEWETATDRYAYRAFGLEAARSGTTDNPFTYVGRQSYYKDPELELYLLGARYYDPQAGRFLSEDPLRYQSDDVNLYAYVHNNPVNATDPSGQAEIVYRASGVYMKTTTGVQLRIGTAEMEQQFFLGIFWGIGPKSGTKTRLLDEFGGWEFDNSVWQDNALEITVRLFERYLPEPASQLSGDDLKFYARWYLSNRGHFGLEEQRREAQRRMDREGYIGSEFSGANRRPTARYQQPESPPPASATPAALASGSAANRSAVPRDGAPSDGYDAKLAAATQIAQRVPDFEEFHSEKAWKSYEAWKAAAGLACLDAVESASQSPDFGMTPAEVRILFGVWDAIARAHYNPVNPNDRKISAAPVHSPGYQAWLDARNARWEHKAQLDWAFDPKNEHDPRAGKIRADHYVARGYVVGWVGYKAPRSDIQLIFKAFGYVPVVGIPALLADATVHAYHGEHEEAVLSGFAAISEIAVLAWAARVKPVQQRGQTRMALPLVAQGLTARQAGGRQGARRTRYKEQRLAS
jgi:RHS repeat-associated protein